MRLTSTEAAPPRTDALECMFILTLPPRSPWDPQRAKRGRRFIYAVALSHEPVPRLSASPPRRPICTAVPASTSPSISRWVLQGANVHTERRRDGADFELSPVAQPPRWSPGSLPEGCTSVDMVTGRPVWVQCT